MNPRSHQLLAPTSFCRTAYWVIFGLVLVYINAPLVVLLPISFSSSSYLQFPPQGWSIEWYRRFLETPAWIVAAWNTMQIGLSTAALSTLIGTPAALALVRARLAGKQALMAAIIAPMIVPHIALAIGLYPIFAKFHLLNTHIGVVLGHTVLAVPLVVVIVCASLQNLDPSLERAALSLGANPWQSFRRITLPLTLPGIIGGALFAFTTSFDELLVALFISGTKARTLPRLFWEQVQYELTPTIAVVSVLILGMSLTILLLAEVVGRWKQRKILATAAEGR